MLLFQLSARSLSGFMSGWTWPFGHQPGGFFIFLFFIFIFYKNIFSIWKFIRIYPGRPAAGRPGPGWPPGSRAAGAYLQKFSRGKLRAGPWGPVARQRGSRPWPPGCGATGRNFCNLSLFAKEFHICALFVTFCRNRPWGRNMWHRDNTSWRHRSRRRGATHAQTI